MFWYRIVRRGTGFLLKICFRAIKKADIARLKRHLWYLSVPHAWFGIVSEDLLQIFTTCMETIFWVECTQ